MDNLRHMSYEELLQLEEDLGDIQRGRALERKHDLDGMDDSALALLSECVTDALDKYAAAEAAYERRDYERSVI